MADYSDYKECTDCVHYELCLHQEKFLIEHNRKDLIRRYGFGLSEAEICCNFRDSSRFVELPCHRGEKVWVTYLGRKEATRSLEKGEVIGFYITASLRVRTSIILEDGTTFTGTYGENVFPRKEKLEERESNAERNDT